MPRWAWECELSFGPVGSQRFVTGVRIQSCDCEQPKRVQHFSLTRRTRPPGHAFTPSHG
jgi:hypothetical protein